MALLEFQRALGRMIMNGAINDFTTLESVPWEEIGLSEKECRNLAGLAQTPGLRLTSEIQRSWSKGRAITAAQLTLSLLPAHRRDQLIDEWIRYGNSTSSFFTTVAIDFLEYLAERLPNPSHVFTVCRFEQAVVKASMGALTFACPNLILSADCDIFLQASEYATLVNFHAEPSTLLNAVITKKALPEVQEDENYLLFAPGISGLFRSADDCDIAIWRMIENPTAFSWLKRKWPGKLIEGLMREGVAELVSPLQ